MKILIICGPTATGKTTLAADLANKFNGELISADSRQVYRGMDIVTGKDRPDVPIWLYDVVDPDEDFSVSQWIRLAREVIADIFKRKKLPIVVGGTGLYIRAFLEPFETIDVPRDLLLRRSLSSLSVSQLQQRTIRGTMNYSDWNNPRRLIRKIEIAGFKSPAISRLQGEALQKEDVLMVGLRAPASILDERIDERLNKRIRMGMEEEIVSLRSRYDNNLPSMSAIGLNEHAYARRQMTWFRKQPGIRWFDIAKTHYKKEVTALVKQWYTQNGN